MQDELTALILELNPWLEHAQPVIDEPEYIPRLQLDKLLSPSWDKLWLILTGPRQAGKTTLGKHLAQQLLTSNRFVQLIYLNCDFLLIREWLQSPLFVRQALEKFDLKNPIIFIDEVQRLESPGLLLKGIADLNYPIKMIASGSSQLEIKSKVQEHLTGRHFEALVLPLSYEELGRVQTEHLIFGCYPKVTLERHEKPLLLKQLYQDYIQKDIIEVLKVGNPDAMQKLIGLLAHQAGQLINYTQLASDCKVSAAIIHNYCDILEKTYTVFKVKPFVGNKRKELIKNPIYYFVDNGFRNQALRNFSTHTDRQDIGLLIESAVFQEIYKFKAQHFYDFDILYWRTQSGAEVDFVLYQNENNFIPIEAKYRKLTQAKISRSMRSFITAYQPENAIIITHGYNAKAKIDTTHVHFISFANLLNMLPLLHDLSA